MHLFCCLLSLHDKEKVTSKSLVHEELRALCISGSRTKLLFASWWFRNIQLLSPLGQYHKCLRIYSHYQHWNFTKTGFLFHQKPVLMKNTFCSLVLKKKTHLFFWDSHSSYGQSSARHLKDTFSPVLIKNSSHGKSHPRKQNFALSR